MWSATLSVLLIASAPAQAAIPAPERQALLDLYTSTNGAGWTVSTNWNAPSGTECTWFGVSCDGAETTVIGIALPSNALSGPLPATLGNLVSLATLQLNSNQLTGAIPSFATNTNLWRLGLGSNQLTGTIPSFTANVNLQRLFLESNQLTGTIPSFAANVNLQTLNLPSNQLTGTIPSFAANASLTSLYLDSNQLSGAIPGFSANTSLQTLHLGSNLLTGTIPSFAANTSLMTLSLNSNQLTGTIPSFAANANLRFLNLSSNQLTGTIPSFAANTSLEYLYLYSNLLTGTLPSFSSNTSLLYAWLRDNQLTGSIPAFASGLQSLDLRSNQLTGAIPSLAANTSLQNLYLQGNQLGGAVHPSLGTLTNLAANGGLDLRWNALFSTDPILIAFLNSKQAGGNWQGTQTIAPTGLGATGILATQVTVNWTPILYAGDSGYYQVFYSTTSGGPYTAFATLTVDKLSTSLTVTGLPMLTPLYFVVRATTLPHGNNQNTVVSGDSSELFATTTPVELMHFEIN